MIAFVRLLDFAGRVQDRLDIVNANLGVSESPTLTEVAAQHVLERMAWGDLAELRDAALALQQFTERAMLTKGGR